MRFLENCKVILAELIFDTRCILCENKEFYKTPGVCLTCQAKLPWLQESCLRCAMPIHSELGYCASCIFLLQGKSLEKNRTFSSSKIFFEYKEPISQWILLAKNHKKTHYIGLLGKLVAYYSELNFDLSEIRQRFDYIIPVPMSHKKFRQRGFNQATELAKPVAKLLGLKVYNHILIKIRSTKPQAELNRLARLSNIKLTDYKVTQRVKNKSIILFDDVMTTGTTCHKLAKLLLQKGAKRVEVWAVARTIK